MPYTILENTGSQGSDEEENTKYILKTLAESRESLRTLVSRYYRAVQTSGHLAIWAKATNFSGQLEDFKDFLLLIFSKKRFKMLAEAISS